MLVCANVFTRALGFVLRVTMSRLIGAEALGVMELSHSAHMLSVAPMTAGLPMAVSRMTARDGHDGALRAGRQLIGRMSAICLPLWLVLSPVIAWLLGDMRVLPALWAFTPCMVILGLSAVYNGYCYGLGNAWPPALSEMLEQTLRMMLTAALLMGLPMLTTAGRAAVPAFSTAIAELMGLALVVWLLRRGHVRADDTALPAARREIVRLSLPLTGSRLLTTFLRAATGALIPQRLMASGLSNAAATGALGMLQGMVMPVLFLPGIVTGALGTVGAPVVAARSGQARKRVAVKLFASAIACGLTGMMLVRCLSGFLAEKVYGLPELRRLFDHAAPLTLFFTLQHAVNSVLSGLGEQKRALLPSLAGAMLSLAGMYVWAAQPQWRILGVVRAMILSQAATLVWSLGRLLFLLKENEGMQKAPAR